MPGNIINIIMVFIGYILRKKSKLKSLFSYFHLHIYFING